MRDYQLVLDDAASGACHVDEGDGIVLRGRLIDGELVTVFRVGDQVLDVRYRPVADGIEFALVSYDPAGGAATGAGLEGPPLRTFAEVFSAVKQGYVEPVEDKTLLTNAISGMLSNLP